MEGRVLARGRARWFFAGHLVVTAASLLLLLALGALDVNVEDRPAWVLLGVMLALYVPAGWITARWQGWSRPTPGEGVRAVLLPALTAWAWALTGWGLVTLTPQEHTEHFKQQLLITKKELQKWQKLNMLIVDNRGL